MEKQIIEKIQNKLPMDIKKFAISMGFLTMVLTACGKNVVDTTQTNPTSTQTVETQVTPVEEDPEVTIPVVEPTDPTNNTETDPVVEPVVEDKYPDATIEKTGDNSYVIHIDCPDNSDAPEIAATLSNDNEWRIVADSELYGISENLLIAVLTHGMQIDSTNPAEISFEAWENIRFDGNAKSIGNMWRMLISNPAEYDIHVYSQANLTHNVNEPLEPDIREACGLLLQDCITETNGNITCGLARYNVGPDVWNQLMQECMDATGLTADEIYANYDANYVYQNDTLGLGNPNYSNEVLEYVNGDIIITSINPIDGKAGLSTTYSIERVKTYGSI